VSLDVGAGLGMRFVYQSFETTGNAPSRQMVSPLGFIGLGLTLPIKGRFYARLDSRLEAHLFQYQAERTVRQSDCARPWHSGPRFW